jgi:prepilin-type N-terminal cleavage/methylation domain-containing protein
MSSVLSRRDRLRREGGFSLIELLIVIAIILIILAIALPKFNAARMNAQETAAISQIKTIATAEVQYYSEFGRYAATLAELGPPAGGGAAGPASADLIPDTLQRAIVPDICSHWPHHPPDIPSQPFPRLSAAAAGARSTLTRRWKCIKIGAGNRPRPKAKRLSSRPAP